MTVMRKYNNLKLWLPAFLLLIVTTACSDPDKTVNPGLIRPTMISETPVSGASGLCTTAVTATFSMAMNSATINGTTFRLTGPGTTPVAGAVTYDAPSNTAIFTPASALAANTLYTATITTGATSAHGMALATNFVWTFTSGSCPAPTVSSETPLSGASGLCTAAVTATFSGAMNSATINGTTFTLTGPGTTPVAGAVTYDSSSRTATFTPTSALAANTLYTATITTGATDTNGIALASDFVWTFTNGSCLPPTVSSVTPLSGAVGLCSDTTETATFSQVMNPSTINGTTFTLTGPGTTPVAGVVTYAASTATFTPTNPLALSTVYTATITTGAKDTFGNALASNFSWSFTTGSTACTPPTVISTAPPDASTGICPNTAVIATFSEAMQPSTISPTTFTLTGPGLTPVAGAVTYAVASDAATFIPTNPLALSTTYTATITTGAQDIAGHGLASDFVWTFTTSAAPCQATVPLGTACTFGGLGGSTVTNSGPTNVTGDVGVWPGSAITGFGSGGGTITGAFHAGDAVAQTAQGDLTTAYNFAAAAPGGAVLPADIGGQTLAPGVYKTTSAQPSLGITGNLTLSGNGVYIFQIISTLTTAATNSDVILSGGASAQDVFWQVGSSATLGTSTTFSGTILAQASVSLSTGATLNGRALARTGAVSLLTNQVNVPSCPLGGR